jgi:ketosteroid isomerase-like protein
MENPAIDPSPAIAHTLDSFHAAASRADFDGYFSAFTPDAVFLGTDATERWTVDEFKAYRRPYFDQGKGWTYLPRQRQVKPLGDVAWVDEVLENEKYGMCRGTALMVRDADRGWLISRYSLAFLIPNDVAAEATALGKK